ncbi:hypothetical protein B484DRAFT_426314, partial [Ochromonadaceae sp. CCMP2298]
MKEIEHGARIQRKLLQQLERANALLLAHADVNLVRQALHWVVVGGGPSGVELTAELCDLVNTDVARHFPLLRPHLRITLLEGGGLLPQFPRDIAAYAQRTLGDLGAEVRCNTLVTR